MTNEEIFSIWAPEASIWSPWVKPVLFAHSEIGSGLHQKPSALPDTTWAPAVEANTAIILDLPGDEAVWVSLDLAELSYRPVPLYNAIPLPTEMPPELGSSVIVVNLLPIVSALHQGAEALGRLSVPPEAPPVFLLDANRSGSELSLDPGRFDNRSHCFTTDFPSADFLLSHGISKILLVQRERIEPQRDLTEFLHNCQSCGLRLERMRIEAPTTRQSFQVRCRGWFDAMFQRVLVAVGLRRPPVGGFGDWVARSPAGG